MAANQADQQNQLQQRENELRESMALLQSELDHIKNEHRVQYDETLKERERLVVALKEAEQKARDAESRAAVAAAELTQRPETGSDVAGGSSGAAAASSAAQLEQQMQMEAIKSKMNHLEKTNAELVAKNEELVKEKNAYTEKEAKFSDTMVKGKADGRKKLWIHRFDRNDGSSG